MKTAVLSITTVLLLLLIISGCQSAIAVRSTWQDQTITTDGNDTDWGENVTLIPGTNVTIGTRNDKENFYFMLKTDDRQRIMTIMQGRLIIWFDSSGGMGKRTGIRFPLPRKEPGMPLTDAKYREMITEMQQEFEIYTENEKVPVHMYAAEEKSFALHFSIMDGIAVLEMKVPMTASPGTKFAVAGAGPNLGVGIETIPRDEQAPVDFSSGSPNPMTGGSSRGSRSGRSTGGSSRPSGAGRSEPRPDQPNFWLNVELDKR
jgi:hypothetical protein